MKFPKNASLSSKVKSFKSSLRIGEPNFDSIYSNNNYLKTTVLPYASPALSCSNRLQNSTHKMAVINDLRNFRSQLREKISTHNRTDKMSNNRNYMQLFNKHFI